MVNQKRVVWLAIHNANGEVEALRVGVGIEKRLDIKKEKGIGSWEKERIFEYIK